MDVFVGVEETLRSPRAKLKDGQGVVVGPRVPDHPCHVDRSVAGVVHGVGGENVPVQLPSFDVAEGLLLRRQDCLSAEKAQLLLAVLLDKPRVGPEPFRKAGLLLVPLDGGAGHSLPSWTVADVRVAVQEGPVGRILELATVKAVVVDVGVGVGASAEVLDLWQEGVDCFSGLRRDVVAVVGDRVGRLERVGVKDVAGHAVRSGRLSNGGVVVQEFRVHHVPTKPCPLRHTVVDVEEKTLRVDYLCNCKDLTLWKRCNARKAQRKPAVEDLLRLQLDRGLPCTVDGQALDGVRFRKIAVDANQAFYKGTRASDRLDAAGAVAGAEAGAGAVELTGTGRATLEARLTGALRRPLLVQEAGAVARAHELVHDVDLVGVGEFNVCIARVKTGADVLASSAAVRAP